MKIQKAKCTTLSEDLFLFQVSKGSAVRFPRNVPGKIDAEEKSGIIRIIIILIILIIIIIIIMIIIIIRNRAKTICLINFVWET